MRFKLLLLTITLLTFSVSVFAKSAADSIGVENQGGKKVILHKLDPKDNYYSIGRRYNVSPKTIIAFNKNAKMTIGNIIKVPTERPFNQPSNTATKITPQVQKPIVQQPIVNQPQQEQQPQQQPAKKADTSDGVPTQYKVSAGETLYSIAKRFNTTVEDITNLNGLKSNTIAPGQVLLVKSNTPPLEAPQTNPTQPIQGQTTPPIVATRDST